MLGKILLWGIGAIALAAIGAVFLLIAKKQIKNLKKGKK